MNRKIFAVSMMGVLAIQGCKKTEAPQVAAPAGEHAGHQAVKKQMWHCPMHPNLIREEPGKCPICGMTLVQFTPEDDSAAPSVTDSSSNSASHASHQASSGAIVKLDASVIQTTGVTTESVKLRRLESGIHATGRITPDESRYASVPLRTMGYVESLVADRKGMKVRKGQVLSQVYSPDVVVAQEEMLRSSGEFRDAARRRLQNWGVDEDLLRKLDAGAPANKTFSVKSPIDGIVMEKMVVQGQAVMPGMEMYRILDLSRVWVMAQVPQGDLSRLQVGAGAEITVSGLPGRTFRGKVTWIAPEMNMETRTAQARIEVPNTAGMDLRLEMFADVEIAARSAQENVLAVPQQAIIPSGTRTVAIVSLGGGRFQPREVKVGIVAGGYAQILSGLEEGDQIVTSAQFLLDSESNLRAALSQMTGGAPAGHQHGN